MSITATKPRPDFICVGFHKCGTSWLYENLREHPEIFMPPIKELNYFLEGRSIPNFSYYQMLFHNSYLFKMKKHQFSKIVRNQFYWRSRNDREFSLNFVRPKHSDGWYNLLFPLDKISGDISPTYCFLENEDVKNIAERFGHLKIIICLRNPVERVWSHVKMNNMLSGNTTLSTEEALQQAKIMVDRYPKYKDVLTVWQKYFKKIHLVFQDEITNRPNEVMHDVLNFLECKNTKFISRHVKERILKGDGKIMPVELKRYLCNHYLEETTAFDELVKGREEPKNWLKFMENELT